MNKLQEWATSWCMNFNPSKCVVLNVARPRIQKFNYSYSLKGETLTSVKNTPYLGVILSETLEWSAHASQVAAKARGVLAFLRRNLKLCPRKLKETAYISMVRSTLEYSSTIWDPHQAKDITILESIQRSAARFTLNNYRKRDSVTAMLTNLGWDTLQQRRKNARLIFMFKILNGLINIPVCNSLTPSDTRTRSKNDKNFKFQRTTTSVGHSSFWPRTIKDWNNIPQAAVDATTVAGFKAALQD